MNTRLRSQKKAVTEFDKCLIRQSSVTDRPRRTSSGYELLNSYVYWMMYAVWMHVLGLVLSLEEFTQVDLGSICTSYFPCLGVAADCATRGLAK